MSMILNIDTSVETATVCLADQGIPLYTMNNAVQKDHAVFLHRAIQEIAGHLKDGLNVLSAVAVTEGPGSYTGLRVGMAAAKGLSYALNKPLITIGTLPMMAKAAIDQVDKTIPSSTLFCTLIDARRMEVFTALYDVNLNELAAPAAMILDDQSFAEILSNKTICFFGTGAEKFQQVLKNEHAFFTKINDFSAAISRLSYEKFTSGVFTDLVHSEPLYIKEYLSFPPSAQ
jgi:tRNA threonylcarbamoyladenosine biosynthesis protein TsaB